MHQRFVYLPFGKKIVIDSEGKRNRTVAYMKFINILTQVKDLNVFLMIINLFIHIFPQKKM